MVMINLSGGRVNPVCEESSIILPRIVFWAPVILELMGHNVTLPCSAIGQPSPSIRWLDDDGLPIGSPLNHGRYFILHFLQKFILFFTTKIIILYLK